ncbi:MAG TPA: thioredoxin domain-containing protein [Propionibacteriaceae bacterium]
MSKKASAKRTPATTADTAVTTPASVAEKANRREQLRIQREAELKAAQQKKRLTIGLGIIGVVVAISLIAWGVYAFKDKIGATNAVPPHANGDKTGIVANPGKAKSGAPLFVIYQDYQCPGCKQYHTVFGTKLREAADAGKIQLEYRTMNFLDSKLANDASTRSAVAAACADNAGVYQGYYDAVYDNQPAIEGAGYSNDLLRVTIPTQLGLSGDKLSGFQKCYDTQATLQFINGTNDVAGRAGITTTPTYMYNGKDITKVLTADPTSVDPYLGS